MEGSIEVNEISDFISYIRSIEWRDPWLMALLSFHALVTFMCLSTRNYGNFQVLLFMILLLLVYFSESINEVAARNWTLFSRQQYFDSKGLFISVVFSIPILLNCMIMVDSRRYLKSCQDHVLENADFHETTGHTNLAREPEGSWLYQSTQLMANLKTAQLRQRFKEMNKEQRQARIKSD